MKSLRKLRALPLLLALMALLALPALADSEYEDGDFKFTLNQARATITKYTGEGGSVVVPSQVNVNGKYYTVAGIKSDAFGENDSVVSVIIPDSVIEVGNSAFYECTSLTYVKLPSNLSVVGGFSDCYELQTVVMPSCECTINSAAFQDCYKLSTIDLSKATEVGGAAFYQCRSLTYADLRSCTKVWNRAFMECTGLKSAVFGDKLKSIESEAFWRCTALESVELGNTVEKLGQDAFKESGLLSVTVPASSQGIDYFYVFDSCKSLKEVYFYGRMIDFGYFRGCSSLESVTLGPDVKKIGGLSFKGTAIESITIPKGTEVSDSAFEDAPFLTTIYGYKNSSAEEYADKNGLVFIPLNEPEEQTISVSKNSFTMGLKSTLSLKASSSSGIVDYQTSDPSVATVSSDGTVSAQGIGQAIITITAPETDEYQSASRLVEIIVCPKKNKIKSVSGNAKSVTVKWTKDTAAQGYLVQWCKKSSFKGAKSATISKNSTVSKVIKKPGKGKWYFRVGSYKTISGKKQCVWSKTVSKKLK